MCRTFMLKIKTELRIVQFVFNTIMNNFAFLFSTNLVRIITSYMKRKVSSMYYSKSTN